LRAEPRVTWRESVESPFVWSAPLEGFFGAQPNLDCSRVYYSGAGRVLVSDAL